MPISSQGRIPNGRASGKEAKERADPKEEAPLLREFLSGLVQPYLRKNPTASKTLHLIRSQEGGPVAYDHLAFRTFGVDGHGIESLASAFTGMGYTQMDELKFVAKKLRAFWFAPPQWGMESDGDGCDGPLPRVFISELLVSQLMETAQEVIHRHLATVKAFPGHAALSAALGVLPWHLPQLQDYEALARESEYAAWTLVNGYALNHTTVSVHRLKSVKQLGELNGILSQHGIQLNSEGGEVKKSPDGLLLQSSTVADMQTFHFACAHSKTVPSSYMEFAERLVLPHFSNISPSEVKEHHRRDGFEVSNADKIFESTYAGQTGGGGNK